jgi:hypothetical protein
MKLRFAVGIVLVALPAGFAERTALPASQVPMVWLQDLPKDAVQVRTAGQFSQAVINAKPGTTIAIAPGVYEAGFSFVGIQGKKDKPIVIRGADPKNAPVFKGGNVGLHLAQTGYVHIQNLVFEGQRDVGLNIDDGGNYTEPARGVRITGVTVRDMTEAGNHDGIKLSGLHDFAVTGSQIVRWGPKGGQGIDMVGCANGTIRGCAFTHNADEEESIGIQAKGGSRNITISGCLFENAGGRAVNVGGSTGFAFFRPPLDRSPKPAPVNFEAQNITVEGCVFTGGLTPVAFVGVDGATFRVNNVKYPKKWALRILQETQEADFVPCRNVRFEDNVIVFRSDRWTEGGVNIGPKTAPKTFTFARNAWQCEDKPEQSRPKLPTPEKNGVYGQADKER